MSEKYEFDSVDYEILSILQNDARTPYLEIARKLIVSGGTVHQRIDKMKQAGIILGSKLVLDTKKLGLDVTVFLGIHLTDSSVLDDVLEAMRKIKEITEVHYTTGSYGLLIKIQTKTIGDFHQLLINKLQQIRGIRATESFISLDNPIYREVPLTR